MPSTPTPPLGGAARSVLQIIEASKQLHVCPDVDRIWHSCPMSVSLGYIPQVAANYGELEKDPGEGQRDFFARRVGMMRIGIADLADTLEECAQRTMPPQKAFTYKRRTMEFWAAVWDAYKKHHSIGSDISQPGISSLKSVTFLQWLAAFTHTSRVWLEASSCDRVKWHAGLVFAFAALQVQCIYRNLFESSRYTPAQVFASTVQGRNYANRQAAEYSTFLNDIHADWQNIAYEVDVLRASSEARLSSAILDLLIARKQQSTV